MQDSELSDREHVRKRPGMYIGSVDERGVLHLVFEAIDNAVDRFLRHEAIQVVISIEKDQVTVTDDGNGYPLDQFDLDGFSLGSKYLTQIHNQNTADEHVPHVHCMSFGAGLFTLNSLTEKLHVCSWRNGECWKQEFSRGIASSDARVIGEGNGRGTTVDFILDSQIFPITHPNVTKLGKLLKPVPYLFPGLRLVFQGTEFRCENGLAGFVLDRFETPETPETAEPQYANRDRWVNRTAFYLHHTCDEFDLQVAAFGETDAETEWLGFANGGPSFEGGTHVEALRHSLAEQVGWKPAIASISAILMSPQFSGPTRTRLDIPEFSQRFKNVIAPSLFEYCNQWQLGNFAENPS